MTSYQLLPQTKAALQHIIDYTTTNTRRPLVVGVTGLPEMGKTTLCHTLSYVLEQDYGLETATLSLDTHSTRNSLADVLTTLKNWIQTGTYSVIFVEGTFMGYKALPSTHRIWSQLSTQQQQEQQKQQQQQQQPPKNNDPILSLQKFNQTLIPFERNLYPLIDLFIQLSVNRLEDWHSLLGKQSTVFQLYLERLGEYGFFDQDGGLRNSSSSSSNNSINNRHLVLFLDRDRKLVQQRRIVDSLGFQQQHQVSKAGNNKHQIVTRTPNAKRTITATTASGTNHDRHHRTWLLSPLIQQQRKYIIATLNPRVLISFAMMSLLGLLGYSRRLSFILDLFNKIHQFVL